MSKQSEAKVAQNYVERPDPVNCSHCKEMTFEMELPEWMAKENQRHTSPGTAPRWTVEENARPKNLRCAIGKFAVKKTATCMLFVRKPTGAA